jgi:hypothetical protein
LPGALEASRPSSLRCRARAWPPRGSSRRRRPVDDLARRGGVFEELRQRVAHRLLDLALTSLLPSWPLVWPSNCGSVIHTLTIAVNPSRTSSPVMLFALHQVALMA